jgi:hypothetical protein
MITLVLLRYNVIALSAQRNNLEGVHNITMEENDDKPEITECIHAHHIETNPYSHDSVDIHTSLQSVLYRL